MDNFLDNGAILPSGLLSTDTISELGAFSKKYQNAYLRVGIITASYDIQDVNNINKAAPEYDVLVFEQNEDSGSTLINYRNCIASGAFGSVADFFEARLRAVQTKNTNGFTLTPSGQNGAIVLILCMNGFSAKGIIVSALLHPDRKTTLNGSGLHLESEYNGVNIEVNDDGSAKLTFKGATDNNGVPIDPSQGNTVIQIAKDGSFQVDHSTITFRLDRSGDVSLIAKKDVNVTAQGSMNLTIKGDVNIECENANVIAKNTATVDGTTVKLGKDAVESVIKGNIFSALFNAHTHDIIVPVPGTPTTPPIIPLLPNVLSTKVKVE